MSFDPNALLVAMAAGLVGFALFTYGRKQGRFPHMLAGAALVVYPYFVADLGVSAAIGVVIVGALALAVRLGA
jgi:hypothetical protein